MSCERAPNEELVGGLNFRATHFDRVETKHHGCLCCYPSCGPRHERGFTSAARRRSIAPGLFRDGSMKADKRVDGVRQGAHTKNSRILARAYVAGFPRRRPQLYHRGRWRRLGPFVVRRCVVGFKTTRSSSSVGGLWKLRRT